MSNVTITIMKNGPVLVSGGPALKTAAGEDVDTGGREGELRAVSMWSLGQ